jgi:Tol biopolymer transport system component
MSKVDDELTRRLRRAERPLDGNELFVGLVRRRAHRERLRRVQAGLMAFAVLAATAGGFVALRAAFRPSPPGSADSPALVPPNGLIVFSRVGEDGRSHLFTARPDGMGVEQLTHGGTNEIDSAISPDGQWITLVRSAGDSFTDVGTVPFDDPDVEPVEPRFSSSISPEPSWSADSSMIAVREGNAEEPLGTALLIVPLDGESSVAHQAGRGGDLAHPSWSPDSRIVFAIFGAPGERATGWDLASVSSNGMGFRSLVAEAGDQISPTWSSDGSRIAYLQPGDRGYEIWTISPDGMDKTLIAVAEEASLESELAWAPDGSALLVSDGEWIYRVDATPEGDPRENFVRLLEGRSPSWQPLPAGSDPSPSATPEPSISPDPEPVGRDIGLGVRMCDLEVLHGIDWDGSGVDGAAWIGAPVDEDGRCSSSTGVQHIVAIDRDGDGIAEQGSTSTLRSCLLCRPFDTLDLNDDGVLELVVLEEASSTPTYSVYEVNRPGSERSPGVYPIFVVAPGAPAMNLDKNEAVRFTVGGDEGFSGSIVCEDASAGAPILRYTWVRGAVDADTELRVDITRLSFGEDGVFHIESVDRFSVPRDPEPTDLKSTEPACGVDFHPAA